MTAPYIVAIDPATRSGFCHGRVGQKPALLARDFGGDDKEAVFGNAVHFFAAFLKTVSPDLIVIEVPIQAVWGKTNADTTDISRGLYGIFSGIARCKNIKTVRAEIATWRKYALGNGRLPGKAAKAASLRLCAQLGWDAPTHDAAESAMIWLWAGSQVAPRQVHRVEPLFAHAGAA